jgi:predicted RNA-binding protein with RPS1 domain
LSNLQAKQGGVFLLETLAYRGKWIELGKELESVVRKNSNLPKEEKKTLNTVFEEFAEKHDTTPNSASRYYYNEIKPKLDEEEKKPIDIDESINSYANSITTEFRDPRTFIKIGETTEIEITSIHDFGVFGRTKDGIDGLIHISEITNEFVTLPEDYFYVGEKVRAKVKRIDNEGKVAFSTRAIGGKQKINPAFKDISKTTIGDVAKITVAPKVEKIEPIKVEEPKEVNNVNPVSSNDRDNIINFIKRYSDNAVSQKALVDIDDMISNFGVFQTTISLMEAIRDLDISSYITEKTMEKLTEGECLRRNS